MYMKTLKPVALTIFLLSVFFCISPMYGENAIMITPLEELNSNNKFILDIKQMILTNDEYSQSRALSALEKIISQELYNSIETELISILHHICTNRELQNTDTNNFYIRKKGIELIRRLGMKTRDKDVSRMLEYLLIKQLPLEKDITCASSIIFSLGMMGSGNTGSGNTGQIIQAIAAAVDTWTLHTRDKEFAFAVITSIENLAHKNNGIQEEEVYTTLIKIMQSTNDDLLRKKSLEVMNLLVTYGDR